MTRPAALVAIAGGLALLVLPFLTWFTATGPGGRVSVSGVDASGGLWSVPVFGAVGAIAAAVVLRRPARRSPMGLLVAAAGGAALAWTLWVSLTVPVALTTRIDGAARALDLEPSLAWPAVGAPIAAGAMCAAGVALVALEVREMRAGGAGRRG